MDVKKTEDAVSGLEAQAWLYRFAKRNGIIITEFRSGDGLNFCHLEKLDTKSSTAVSRDKLTALFMCFLNFENKKYTFLEDADETKDLVR